MNIRVNSFWIFILLFFITVSCKKEKQYQYEVNPITIKKSSANKNANKNANEFIAISYSDLFASTIKTSELEILNKAYIGFADKKYVEELMIKKFIKRSGTILPSNSNMRANVEQFIIKAYKQIYIREPSEYELNYLKNYINSNTELTVQLFYYSLLTSSEYRYY